MKWKEQEIEKLKEIYPKKDITLKEIIEIIGKSKKAICHKASRLGLNRPGIIRNKKDKPRQYYDKKYYEDNKPRIMFLKKLRFRKLKIEIVKFHGGKCEICGYDKCMAALEFHHQNKDKEYSVCYLISRGLMNKGKEEAKKCRLLCSNCHREIHWKMNIKLDKKILEKNPKRHYRASSNAISDIPIGVLV